MGNAMTFPSYDGKDTNTSFLTHSLKGATFIVSVLKSVFGNSFVKEASQLHNHYNLYILFF